MLVDGGVWDGWYGLVGSEVRASIKFTHSVRPLADTHPSAHPAHPPHLSKVLEGVLADVELGA